MNKLAKTATATGLAGLGLLLLIIVSGIGYPNPLFNYGVLFGLVLILVGIILYVLSWIVDFNDAVKRKDHIGAFILILAATLFVCSFLK